MRGDWNVNCLCTTLYKQVTTCLACMTLYAFVGIMQSSGCIQFKAVVLTAIRMMHALKIIMHIILSIVALADFSLSI